MKVIKMVSMILLATMLFTILGACGQAKQSEQTQNSVQATAQSQSVQEPAQKTDNQAVKEKAVVTFMKWGDGVGRDKDLANIKKFSDANPDIEAKAEIITYNDYLSKINTLIAAGSTPDVFFINEFLPIEWGEKGIGADLTPFFNNAGIDPNERYIGSALFQSKGKLWALSADLCTIFVYYNKTLFKDAGVPLPSFDASNSWTWDQMVDAAKKITTDKSGKHPGEAGFNSKAIKTYGILPPTFWLYNMPLLYSNGASYATPDGMALGLDTPEAIQVMQGISDMINKDYTAPSIAISKSLPASGKMVMDGQVGMEIGGTWANDGYATENYDVGVAPMPTFKKPSNIAWSACYMLSSQSKYPDAAFKLFRYVTDPDVNDYVLNANLPNLKEYYSDSSKFAKWSQNPNFKFCPDFLKVIPSTMTVAISPENLTLKDFGPIVDQTIQPELDKLWLGEKSAADMVPILKEKTAGKFKGSWTTSN